MESRSAVCDDALNKSTLTLHYYHLQSMKQVRSCHSMFTNMTRCIRGSVVVVITHLRVCLHLYKSLPAPDVTTSRGSGGVHDIKRCYLYLNVRLNGEHKGAVTCDRRRFLHCQHSESRPWQTWWWCRGRRWCRWPYSQHWYMLVSLENQLAAPTTRWTPWQATNSIKHHKNVYSCKNN